jgi:ribosome modulation factor
MTSDIARDGPAEDDPVKQADPDRDPSEVERQGHVAFHHGKTPDVCPYAAGDPLRERWLVGWVTAKSRTNRLDMPATVAAGWRGYRNRLRKDECPLSARENRKGASEWLEGWERGRQAQEAKNSGIATVTVEPRQRYS